MRQLTILLVILAAGPALAQAPRQIVIEVADRAPRDLALVDAVARAAGGRPLHGAELARAMVEGPLAQWRESDRSRLDELHDLAREGIQDFYYSRFVETLEKLTRAISGLNATVDVVGREERYADALFDSEMIVVVTLRHLHREDEALEVMRQAIRLFPDRRPTIDQFSPDLIRFWDETKAGMDAGQVADLELTSRPSGCTVLRNGQEVGTTPWRSHLYPGALTLQLRCGDRLSGVRRANLDSGTNQLEIDMEAESAIHATPVPWLGEVAGARHAASLVGRALGAASVVLVMRRTGRVIIEIVASSSGLVTERGEGPNAAAAWAAREEPRDERSPAAPTDRRARWYEDAAAWLSLGTGVGAAVSGLALLASARSDAAAAPTFAESDPARYLELASSARDGGQPAVLLLTAGTGLALGSIVALVTPAARQDTTFRGPLFWALAAAGVVTASTGIGLIFLDGCAYEDHRLCPAVPGDPLDANAPAGLILSASGAVVLATALVLRLTESQLP
ncbi:MAG: hypothetical protein HYY06_12680 [Deltaproteobacteria bacterium]|nr:hypothetical protein [Deltaproteobacteria bacterium]